MADVIRCCGEYEIGFIPVILGGIVPEGDYPGGYREHYYEQTSVLHRPDQVSDLEACNERDDSEEDRRLRLGGRWTGHCEFSTQELDTETRLASKLSVFPAPRSNCSRVSLKLT